MATVVKSANGNIAGPNYGFQVRIQILKSDEDASKGYYLQLRRYVYVTSGSGTWVSNAHTSWTSSSFSMGATGAVRADTTTNIGWKQYGSSTSSYSGSAYYTGGSGTKYTSSVTIGAYTVPKPTYTISYNANGGSGAPSAQTKIWGTNLTLSSTKPTRTGYTFLGWSTSSIATSATYSAGGSYTSNSAATLYAVWQVNKVQFAYNPNGGTVSASGYGYNDYGWVAKNGATYFHSINYGESDDLYNATSFGLTKTGYTFSGYWHIYNKTDGITSTKFNQDTSYGSTSFYDQSDKNKTTANTTTVTCYLYAGWTANTYSVKYNPNDGTGTMANSSHTYDTAKALTANAFTRQYHVFKNWNTKEDGSGTSYTDKASVKNLTSTNGETVNLYAQWTLVGYPIAYYGNKPSVATNAVQKVPSTEMKNAGQTYTINATSPTLTYATFKGWGTSASATSPAYQPGGSYNSDAALNLYAIWALWSHTVAFNANGGSGVPSSFIKTAYTNQTIPSTPTPIRDGYTFKCWNTNSSGTGINYYPGGIYSAEQNGGTVTLYAVWVSNNLMIYKNGACQAIEFVEDPADETNYLHATGVWQAPEFIEAED